MRDFIFLPYSVVKDSLSKMADVPVSFRFHCVVIVHSLVIEYIFFIIINY